MGAKILYAVTVSPSLNLMRGQLDYLRKKGYEVKAICSDGSAIETVEEREGIQVLTVEMEREISLMKDFRSLLNCMKVIRKERPLIVNAGTPKAGLVVSLAALFCRVPIRIYNVLGLRLETTYGLKRLILLTAEKIAAGSATNLLAVSPSLKARLVDLGIADSEKIVILGKGSVNGFDLKAFEKTPELNLKTKRLREDFGLTDEHLVLGFTGRMTKDKGIEGMVEAFLELNGRYPHLRLLIVGDYESADAVADRTQQDIRENPNIIHAGYQMEPIPYYFLMDIFVFLTKREGFGNVSAEAALAGVPVIAADVTGARDTILDGRTGFLVNPENPKDVVEKLERLIGDSALRLQMGSEGRSWARENFSNTTVWEAMDSYYQMLLAKQSVGLGELR